MNKAQNYNNKHKDNRIRELELENSLLKQTLSTIKNIIECSNNNNSTTNTNDKRIDDCCECGKSRIGKEN
jgi:hypothetical protein